MKRDGVSTLENTLLLTSMMENALGNIFYSLTGKVPPHLMRDLLVTKELENIFGKTSVLG